MAQQGDDIFTGRRPFLSDFNGDNPVNKQNRFCVAPTAVVHAVLGGLVWTAIAAAPASAADASTSAPAAPAAPTDSTRLELEVDALSTLNDLQLSSDQIAKLRDLTKDAAGKVDPPEAPGDAKYIAATLALRRAILAGNQDAIDDAQQKLSDLEDQSDADLDPTVNMSEAAKTAAPAAMKLLSPRQLAGFLGEIADSIPDPSDIVMAIDDSHQLSKADFEAERDRLADDFSMMAGGFNPPKPPKIVGRIKQLLDRARRMSNDEFTARTADLHADALKLGEGSDPIVQLRRCSEREMAELLSNPQLPRALDEWKPQQHNNSD